MGAELASNGAVTGAVRVWLRLEGFLVLALSLILYRQMGAKWWVFAVLFLAPDLILLAYLAGPRVGGACYNLVHSYFLPFVVGAAAILMGRVEWLPFILIWTAHIGMDRMLGFGLKYPEGFGKSHLGFLGKAV
jgi:hypothetical protein